MTSKDSPEAALRRQANMIAATIKKAERGDKAIDQAFATKVVALQAAGQPIKVGVIMDDKIITLTLAFERIKETTEAALAEYIFDLMRETRGPVQ